MDRENGRLIPYDGVHYRFGDTQPLPLGERHTLTVYPPDISGRVTYHINSLGYRGEEFRPDAKCRIYASGCSYTFGTGLNEDEIWINLFANRYSAARGLKRGDVNLLNFSQDGGSNDYIARILLAQSHCIRPDVIIALFTHSGRGEFFDRTIDAHPHRIGPWLIDEETMSGRSYVGASEFAEIARRRDGRIIRRAESFYRYNSYETFLINTYKNILLLQFACRASNIPFVFLAMPGTHPPDGVNAAVSRCHRLVTQGQVHELSAETLEQVEDRAADGLHAGRSFHERLAEFAWKEFSTSTFGV